MVQKRVSIKDIAKLMGVSNATVSLVLNGKAEKGRVSEVLTAKIQQAAQQMGYQPNNLARSLRVGHSLTIGLIVADISNSFFGSLAFHIQQCAEKIGYTVIITNTNESVDKMKTMINKLQNRQVDGFLIVPTENSEECIQELVDKNTPLVLLDRYFPFINASYVVTDNYRASMEATRFLIGKKCKNIALVNYRNNLPHILERKSGYQDAMTYFDLQEHICIKEIRYSSIEADMDAAIEELFAPERSVDGILFATNSLSMVGIKKLIKKGILTNKELQIVCFDRSDAFDSGLISVPHVIQPIEEMSKCAVDILINQILNDKDRNVSVRLPADLRFDT